MLSFAGADVLNAQTAALAHPKESGRQASTNNGAVPRSQSTAQGTRPSKRTDLHLPLKQPLKASRTANTGSKYSSGQVSQAGLLAVPSSSAMPPETSQSQTAQMGGFDAAAVSAGLVGSRLPSQTHRPTADEESPTCSMLLVAGSHLRRWLSIVKMVSTYVAWPYVLLHWWSLACGVCICTEFVLHDRPAHHACCFPTCLNTECVSFTVFAAEPTNVTAPALFASMPKCSPSDHADQSPMDWQAQQPEALFDGICLKTALAHESFCSYKLVLIQALQVQSPEQQQAVHRFHSTHTGGVHALLLVHVPAAFAQSPPSPFSPPIPRQLQSAACASEAQPQHQAALEAAVADDADVVMTDSPVHLETAADQSAMLCESTKQGSKLDDANPHGSNVAVHVTAFHLGSTASKDSPAALKTSSSHALSKAGDGGLAQPQMVTNAAAQQLTEPYGTLAAAASAQTASLAGTDASLTLKDSAVAVQLRVDREDRTHVELMLKAPPLAAAAASRQQQEALPAQNPFKAHGPMADVGLPPMPVQEPEADLQAEKSGLQGLQLPKSDSQIGKPSNPSKARRQIPAFLPNSQAKAGSTQPLTEFAAAVFSSEPSQAQTADRHSAPGQSQSALVPNSRAVALPQPPKPLTEASIPPTRGKGADPQLDPAAAYMLSGKPVPSQTTVTSSVTAAASAPTRGKQSDTQLKPATLDLMPGLRLQGLTQTAAAASVTEQSDVVQAAAAQPDSAATKGFSATAGQTVTKAEAAVEAAVEGVTTDRSATVSEAATGAASASKQKQKRTDRQLDAGAQEAPGPKRAKNDSQAKAATAEQPAQHQQQQQQQQQQQAKPRSESQGRVRRTVRYSVPKPDPPTARQSPSHSVDLPPCTLDSIFRSIRKLHLLGSGDRGREQLSKYHMGLLTPLLPLVQLRVLSKYATEVMPHGNVVKFFTKTIEVMGGRSHETWWLVWREKRSYRLFEPAADLCEQLEDCGLLPEGAVPTVTPQLLPFELQAPFVLCLGGYTGSLPLADFAKDLLQALLSQVVLMLHKFCSTADDCKAAQANLELAGGSLSKVMSSVPAAAASQRSPSHDRHAQQAQQVQQAQHAPKTGVKPHTVPPANHVPLSIQRVACAVFEGLVRISRLKDNNFDQQSYNFLQKQPPLWQLRIISQFAECYNGGANSSAFLTSICKQNRNLLYREDYAWLTQHGRRAAGNSPELVSSAQALLDDACEADAFLKGCIDPAILAVLPSQLHCIAVCYAISTAGTDRSTHSNDSAETFVAYAWDLICECDPKADIRDRVQPSSRPRSQSVARAASQPPRNGSLDREASRGRSAVPAAAADQPSDANQDPLGPSDPHRRHPSIPAIAPPTRQGSHIQPSRSPHQAQALGPQSHGPPRHCLYFFSAKGCRTQKCPFYHGLHQEYVAYTATTGLVPYGLKFVSNVGRDKWIVDEAVDCLNKLMLTQQLPQGSFSEHDLRPLAFLEDPNGDHAKLQLQVDFQNCCSSCGCVPACTPDCIQNCRITFLKMHGFTMSWDNKQAQVHKDKKCLMISVVTQG